MSHIDTGNQERPQPSAGDDVVVQVSKLNHWFGAGSTRTQVLFDNDLQITCGEIVIMLGPSGSGKTTLLTLIGALRTVQDGRQHPEDPPQSPPPSLRVLGQELYKLSPLELVEVRRRIGFIFQGHNLFSSLNATQNVQLALELQEKDPRARLSAHGIAETLEARRSADLSPREAVGGSETAGGHRPRFGQPAAPDFGR